MSRLFFQFFFESCNFISELSYLNKLQGKLINQSFLTYSHIKSLKGFLSHSSNYSMSHQSRIVKSFLKVFFIAT